MAAYCASRMEAGTRFKSSQVRKSIVLKVRSMAGAPQIFAPMDIYAPSSLGIFTVFSGSFSREQAQ